MTPALAAGSRRSQLKPRNRQEAGRTRLQSADSYQGMPSGIPQAADNEFGVSRWPSTFSTKIAGGTGRFSGEPDFSRPIRIRVCLQAYRKSPKTNSALAAGPRRSQLKPPDRQDVFSGEPDFSRPIRIRVCFQAYREPPTMNSALAAGSRRSQLKPPDRQDVFREGATEVGPQINRK
jgi:hypothetical protein